MGPRDSLARGARFLLDRQGHDGLWRDFHTPAGEASEWPTGFTLAAVHLAGGDRAPLMRCAEALLASQREDGGWGYNEIVPSDADSTACVLLSLALMSHCDSSSRRAAEFLIGNQRSESGGVATYREPGPIRAFMGLSRLIPFHGWCAPHTEVTATAGRALAALASNDSREPVAAAWRYVRSRQRADGSWGGYWWSSPHYATAQAVELALTVGENEPAARAAEWALRTQNDDGGWGAPGTETSAFATAMCLSVLVNVQADRRSIDAAGRQLVSLQSEDGGWPSHPIMRIPAPAVRDPDRASLWRLGRRGGGVLIDDQHRTFTSAACVTALSYLTRAAG
jgi:squalene cyclase